MARTDAQRAADKKYAAKINGKYKPFIVNLMPDELAHIDAVIAASGMKKAEFLRWAIKQLEENKGE
jgi:hypothetical protein